MTDYAELVKKLRNRRVCVQSGGSLDEDFPLMREAADAIEELNGFVLEAERDRDEYRERLDKTNDLMRERWIPVTERLPERTNPFHCRDTYLVHLESGCIESLSYEYDNADRCKPGTEPLFKEGWHRTESPVTHWMPLPPPPKGEAE